MVMLADNTWPSDFSGEGDPETGKPRYIDMCEYCHRHGFEISLSAMGRWAKTMRTLARMKQAGLITRQVMEGITDEKASQTQKAVAEMITAVAIEYLSDNNDFSSRQIKEVANAMRDCTAIAINSDKYTKTQLAARVEQAADKIDQIARKKKLDPETLKMIREEVYGLIG